MCGCIHPGVLVCSLKRDIPQEIEPGGYHIVRFPFSDDESYDAHAMHQSIQPDAFVINDDGWDDDDRSGLIWPTRSGWGTLHALIQWGSPAATATEYRDQFVRDPLGLFAPPDTTATDHRAPSPGGQYWSKTHGIFVHPGVPLALRVAHNAPIPLALTLAEFKLAIHPAA
ncbi:hypothetical protein [Streptomyces sp. NRRL B-1347]|uniref:hypothetical protein n=1 Tax=Streptomyces sp. NRRL B-1347 TaxID=1476877 RepID=UPI0004C61E11|nr:hypothetical protein [Streptomyces sp. NRRL B-1347]